MFQAVRTGFFVALPLVALSLAALTPAGCSEPAPPSPPPSPSEYRPVIEPPAEGPADGSHQLRVIYVPAYSNIPEVEDKMGVALLSILLSVRNVDSSATITLTHVDYFDTSGHRVRRYLDQPRHLRPLETAEFAVSRRDDAGGSGANFLVYWEGPSDAHPLLTEALMYGPVRGGIATFASRGVALDRRPEPAVFEDPGGTPPGGPAGGTPPM